MTRVAGKSILLFVLTFVVPCAVRAVSATDITPEGALPIPSPPGSQGLITISNGVFVDSQCHEFMPLGWNS
jgi:hypothetical protein